MRTYGTATDHTSNHHVDHQSNVAVRDWHSIREVGSIRWARDTILQITCDHRIGELTNDMKDDHQHFQKVIMFNSSLTS